MAGRVPGILLPGSFLPIHDFFRSLLLVYGVQLHDFTPNAILHIACFITLWECFLGIEPHWGLWKRLYFVKRQASSEGIYSIGGFGISVRSDTKFIAFKICESVQAWRKKWFYIRDIPAAGREFGLPPFKHGETVKRKKSWKHTLTPDEIAETNQLMSRIEELQSKVGLEVSSLQIMATFIRRRIQPLRAQLHPMWQYTGVDDPTRLSKKITLSRKWHPTL